MSDHVNNQLPESFLIADWVFHTRLNRLDKGDVSIKLEPRATQVLLYLAIKSNQPVSREELLENIWSGVVVGDEVLTNVINKLRKALNDDRHNPRFIETIQKTGYRLIAPIKIADTLSGAGAQTDRPGSFKSAKVAFASSIPQSLSHIETHRFRNWLLFSLLLLAGLFFVVIYHLQQQTSEPIQSEQEYISPARETNIDAKPSLVILPFENLSSDPEQSYYAEGLTDDLIAVIARRQDIFVISRESSYFYLGNAKSAEQIARHLQVRYAMQGDVRVIADRIRISARFFDAKTGKLVWEETFEGKLDDIFTMQDSVISKTLNTVLEGNKEQISEVQQTERANNIEAYDKYLYGRKYFYLYASKSDNNKAKELFLKAIEYDPNFANAYAMLAWTNVYEAMNGWSEDRQASLERAYVLSEQAINIQPALPVAYFVRGLVNRERKEFIKALVDVEKALQYDPNYANAHMLMGTLLYYAGQPEESIRTIRKAMRLNPHHPYNYSYHLGQGLYILRRYQEAIEAFESGLETNPSSVRTRVWLAAAIAQSGDIDEAEWQVEQLLLEKPDLSLQKIQHLFPFKDPKDLDHFLDGLRIAGLSQTLVIE